MLFFSLSNIDTKLSGLDKLVLSLIYAEVASIYNHQCNTHIRWNTENGDRKGQKPLKYSGSYLTFRIFLYF